MTPVFSVRSRGALSVMMCVGLLLIQQAPAATALPITHHEFQVTTTIPYDATHGIGRRPNGITIDQDHGRAYVANNGGGTVSVIDTARDEVIAVIPHDVATGIGDGPNSIALDPSTGRGFVTNTVSSTVSVFDLASNAVVYVIPNDVTGVGEYPMGIAVDPSTHRAYVTNWDDGTVSVIDTTTFALLTTIPHDSTNGIGELPFDITLDSAQEKGFVTNSASGSVSVIDLATDTVSAVIADLSTGRTHSYPAGITADIAAGLIYVANSNDNTISVIDAATLVVTKVLDLRDVEFPKVALADVAVDPAKGLLYVSSGGAGTVVVVDTKDQTIRATVSLNRLYDPSETSGLAVEAATGRVFVSDYGRHEVAVVEDKAVRPDSTVTRIDGADRYEVSAHASAASFDAGVPVAYVASGEVFPDALSGSAAAGYTGGPVLLTAKDSLPASIRAELGRLRPKSIFLLGGSATISPRVESALAALAPVVRRIDGHDRFAVSAAVSAGTFRPNVPAAYIASGATFADALSASAAAGASSGPVLLVSKDGVPDSVSDELERLRPAKIVVVGGASSIADSVVSTLGRIARTTRIGGDDRYAVAALVSQNTFTHPALGSTVYVASGAVFPDALSAASPAILDRAPILLVPRDSVPQATAAELQRLAPEHIVVLGGPNTIDSATYDTLMTYLR
ncbi:cell wall-binding repeat-containing protein [Herbiconiux sp.]|uniref:cell wall-binding repeat-containing protein n=1 Tax=Herbiconiux sp. TaxID=1871186 RepID=UPI0025C6B8F9|nr:cell wall-binding repeat-containing protein [Herbiconiux sp.]